MKKIFALVLLLAGFALAADGVDVVCTTMPVTVLTKAVLEGVPGVNVSVLLPSIAGCPHDYSLTPRDMRKLAKADVIVVNGLGMEGFLEGVTGRIAPKAFVIDSSKGVSGLLPSALAKEEPAEKHGQKHGHAEKHGHEDGHSHHAHHEWNEHLFASPGTAAKVAVSIADQFAARYPADAAKIRSNTEKFTAGLRKISEACAALAKTVPEARKKVFVQHGIFDYLAKEAGLEVAGYVFVDDLQEPSAAMAKKLITEIREKRVSAILGETGRESKMTALIARESGAEILNLRVNPDSDSPEQYLKMFRDDLGILERHCAKK